MQAASMLGGSISHHLGGRWTVSLKAYEVEVLLTIAARELTLGLKVGSGRGSSDGSRDDSDGIDDRDDRNDTGGSDGRDGRDGSDGRGGGENKEACTRRQRISDDHM